MQVKKNSVAESSIFALCGKASKAKMDEYPTTMLYIAIVFVLILIIRDFFFP
jgi:hypothetical protein